MKNPPWCWNTTAGKGAVDFPTSLLPSYHTKHGRKKQDGDNYKTGAGIQNHRFPGPGLHRQEDTQIHDLGTRPWHERTADQEGAGTAGRSLRGKGFKRVLGQRLHALRRLRGKVHDRVCRALPEAQNYCHLHGKPQPHQSGYRPYPAM